MSRPTKLPASILVSVGAIIALVAIRYVAALDSGVDHVTALRTYLFWAVVCVPVAAVGELLGRTVLNYRVVQLALARVTTRRTERR